MPHSIALAATLLEQGDLSVVKAWLESGGDANGLFDPDAHDGGREACHPTLNAWVEGGVSVLMLAVGLETAESDADDCEERLELIRYLISRGADPNIATSDGCTPLHLLAEMRSSGYFRFIVANLLCDAGANLEACPAADGTLVRGYTPLAAFLANYHEDNVDYLRLLLRRGASLDFPAVQQAWRGIIRNTAEEFLRAQLLWFASTSCSVTSSSEKARYTQRIEEKLRLVTAVRAAGSWKSYLRTPHKSLLRLRSLLARDRARRRPLWDKPTPHALVRLFAPSLPNGVFWHVLSYWREAG